MPPGVGVLAREIMTKATDKGKATWDEFMSRAEKDPSLLQGMEPYKVAGQIEMKGTAQEQKVTQAKAQGAIRLSNLDNIGKYMDTLQASGIPFSGKPGLINKYLEGFQTSLGLTPQGRELAANKISDDMTVLKTEAASFLRTYRSNRYTENQIDDLLKLYGLAESGEVTKQNLKSFKQLIQDELSAMSGDGTTAIPDRPSTPMELPMKPAEGINKGINDLLFFRPK
jgi:hypothetical protein